MTGTEDPGEGEISRLYALPLDEFTAARDELAKRLRGEGEREQAKEVKRLRKPSLAAWALNQVRRDDPRGVEELLAAGAKLRESTESLLAGGDREQYERATAEERRLVKELSRHGERQLVAAGHSVTVAVQNKLVATLRAVASDSEARELWFAGRLVRDHEVTDLGMALPTAERKTPRGAPPGPAAAPAAERAANARKVRGVRQRLERAQGRVAQIEEQAVAAARRVEEAQHDLTRASSVLEREEAKASKARVSAREATDRVTELEASLRALEARSAAHRREPERQLGGPIE